MLRQGTCGQHSGVGRMTVSARCLPPSAGNGLREASHDAELAIRRGTFRVLDWHQLPTFGTRSNRFRAGWHAWFSQLLPRMRSATQVGHAGSVAAPGSDRGCARQRFAMVKCSEVSSRRGTLCPRFSALVASRLGIAIRAVTGPDRAPLLPDSSPSPACNPRFARIYGCRHRHRLLRCAK